MRAFVELLLLSAFVSAPGADAAPRAASLPVLSGDVTLTGASTGYVRVSLTRTLDLAKFDVFTAPPRFGGSAPVGFALLPDAVGSTATNLVVVRMPTERGPEVIVSPASGYDPVTGDPDTPFLRPGTYRLFFLTRGGGSVRFRLPGQPGEPQRLTATKPVRWTFREYAAPIMATGYGAPFYEATLDVDARQPGHVFGALWHHTDHSAHMQGEGCFFTGWNAADRAVPGCAHAYGPGPNARIGPEFDKHDRVWMGGIYDESPGKVGVRLAYRNAGTVRSGGGMIFYLPEA